MINLMNDFWLRLNEMLRVFADSLLVSCPSLTYDAARSSNDAFLLRGYLEFRRSRDGDEIAITIDVQQGIQKLSIEVDICSGTGKLLANGFYAEIPLEDNRLDVTQKLDDWLNEFQKFLNQNEPVIVSSLSKLT